MGTLTKLLALYGVYALFVIFYTVWRYLLRSVRDATSTEDRAFFKIIQARVQIAVFALAAVVAVVWIIATFHKKPKVWVQGVFKGLPHDTRTLTNPGDKAVVYEVSSVSDGLFLQRSTRTSLDPKSIDLEWVFGAQAGLKQLVLQVDHQCSYLDSEPLDSATVYLAATPKDKARITPRSTKPLNKWMAVALAGNEELLAQRIGLKYDSDPVQDDCKNMGNFEGLADGPIVPVKWLRSRPVLGEPLRASVPTFLGSAIAWAEPLPNNSPAALTSDEIARLQDLAARDPEARLAAQQILVAKRSTSYPFIELQLQSAATKQSTDRMRLVESLETVVEKLESSGLRAPQSVQIGLATALYEIGDDKSASTRFNGVSSETLDAQRDIFLMRGAADTRAGNYSRAKVSFEAYIRTATTPRERSLAQANLGALSMVQGKNEEGIPLLIQALESDPHNEAARLNLGLAYLRSDHFDRAAATFEQALRVDPSRIDIKLSLSFAYQRGGRLDAAIALLEGLVKTAPDQMTAKNNLAYCYALRGRKGDLDRASDLSQEALAHDPERATYLDTRGWVLFQQRRFLDSVAVLEKAASKTKDSEIQDHLVQARHALASSHAAHRNENLYSGLDAELITILRGHPQAGLFLVQNIDQRKVAETRRRLANARSAARVPNDETVVGLIDGTLLGTADDAVVFGGKGVYYHTFWPRQAGNPYHSFVPYSDFPKLRFSAVGNNALSFGNGNFFSGGAASAVDVVSVLNAIKGAVSSRLAR